MNIKFRALTADEAWQYVLYTHAQYHKYLKPFGYSYDMFIPHWSLFDEMFEIAQPLNPQQELLYRDKFLSKYNEAHLHIQDEFLKSEALLALERAVDTLAPFAKKWGIKIPDDVTIKTTYGYGASYNPNGNNIILRVTRYPAERIVHTLRHELVHLIIEKPIIEKYNVPQDLKERIVDIICYEYFGTKPQDMFINSFANKYINRTTIESDLPGAVKKMMADFALVNQKIANAKSNG